MKKISAERIIEIIKVELIIVRTGIRVVNIAEWVLPVIVEINSLLLD